MKFYWMSNTIKLIVILYTTALLFGCSGGSSGGDNPVSGETDPLQTKPTWYKDADGDGPTVQETVNATSMAMVPAMCSTGSSSSRIGGGPTALYLIPGRTCMAAVVMIMPIQSRRPQTGDILCVEILTRQISRWL